MEKIPFSLSPLSTFEYVRRVTYPTQQIHLTLSEEKHLPYK